MNEIYFATMPTVDGVYQVEKLDLNPIAGNGKEIVDGNITVTAVEIQTESVWNPVLKQNELKKRCWLSFEYGGRPYRCWALVQEMELSFLDFAPSDDDLVNTEPI